LNKTTSKLIKLFDNVKIKNRYQQLDVLLKWTTRSEQNEIGRRLDEIKNSKTKALLYIKDEYLIVRCFAQKKLGLYEV